ncbi:transposase [Mastigocoleus sp. MO_188.B34]|uniref:transposase n=1 Tax=Mastigocoleus sp. MO_188.B34 TaxID=3036635 RepID=UPI00263461DA|nr:transposase [Mastigocoleus sp. MO_188.B34]MDJ0693790.1 transposase [Mastigocoleus sp. MO_188.B34]
MRKLTDSDKKEILKLYRESAETTSTLAERYGVSNSTISRLLKSTLPEDEYEYLVSLKRAARTPEGRAQVNYENIPVFAKEEIEEPEEPKKSEKPKKREKPAPVKKKAVTSGERRVKRRSSATTAAPIPTPTPSPVIYSQQLEIFGDNEPEAEIANIPSPLLEEEEDERRTPKIIAEMLGEDLLDESEELDDLDDLEDDFDDDFDEDEDDWNRPFVTRTRSSGDPLIKVLPLSAASLPRTCYIVIDRSAELITRPLEEFGDLGEIPNLENQQRTLPIFDNHRIAKRFSTKRDRVIKVPDSKMLHKARYHLQAKGITRLLIDGQVYSLAVSV